MAILFQLKEGKLRFSKLEYGDLIFRANEGVMFAPNFLVQEYARLCMVMT